MAFEYMLGSGLARITVIALLLLLLSWPRWQRYVYHVSLPRDAPPTPPDNLPPALVAKLLGASNRRALYATLRDLANRGYLTLQETFADGQWDFSAARTSKSTGDLAPFERKSLDVVFGGANTIVLERRSSAFRRQARRLAQYYEAALLDRGYITKAGLRRRTAGKAVGRIALVLLIAELAALVHMLGGDSSILAGPLALVMGWLAWGRFPIPDLPYGYDPADYAALERWRGFADALWRLHPVHALPSHVVHLLPYAVATGTEDRLIWADRQRNDP